MKRSFLKNLFTLFCLVAFLSASPAVFGQDAKSFVGAWNGSIEAGGQHIDIAVHFSTDDEGNIQGTIDVPVQGLSGLALSGFEIDGKKITFMIAGVPGEPTLKGELDEAGTKISGSFAQSGVEGSFSLEKE